MWVPSSLKAKGEQKKKGLGYGAHLDNIVVGELDRGVALKRGEVAHGVVHRDAGREGNAFT